MPNKYADDTTSMLVRMPKSLKERLAKATTYMNAKHHEANYSSVSIARNAILSRVEEIEKEMKK